MTGTVTVRDETLGGEPLREWALEVTTERLTVRELIRSRVYQEVQDYNLKKPEVFRGLVEPRDAEKYLNGYKIRKARELDWRKQFEASLEAFESNRIIVLVNERQMESLDDDIVVGPESQVTFVKLVPLVGS